MIVPKSGKILCVGRLYCDLVFSGIPKMPVRGEEVYADSLCIHAGGGAYITAAYLAAIGQKTSLCAIYPSGPFGKAIESEIQNAGIDLSFCQSALPGADPQVTVAIALRNDRAFLTKRSGPSLPDTITQALDDPALTHLHIAELATLAEHPDLPAMARNRGLSVSLDCSWDEDVICASDARDLLRGIDLFLPNEKELRALFNIDGALENHRIEFTKHVPLVIVKKGKNGASLYTPTSTHNASAIDSDVVDTTGAGDAFNAGFLARWLNGEPLENCLAMGNTIGAEATKRIGGASGVASVSSQRHLVNH
ncbi:MAG: carbohydrate kinase family protein [Rhodobacteraceae bacterium]|nr:carbohydrate kinase family protein [Paracoccaceae bacterium]